MPNACLALRTVNGAGSGLVNPSLFRGRHPRGAVPGVAGAARP